jgi:SPP1 family phage portal protein
MAVVTRVPETLALLGPQAAQIWADDNGTWLKDIIDKHKAWLDAEGIAQYQAAYDGYLEKIDLREKSRGDDVNHKLQVNYAKKVIDFPVDYMLGKPIVWTVDDPEPEKDAEGKNKPRAIVEEYRKTIIKLLQNEEAQRVFSEMLRQGSIASYSTVIAWVDEKGGIDYEEYPVQEVVPVYDVRGRLVLVVRFYPYEVTKITEAGAKTTEVTRVEVYDEKYLTYYLSDETGGSYALDDSEVETGNPIEHRAGRIPVSVFLNGTPARYEKRVKKLGTSDLGDGVLSLLEEYASTMSDKANMVDRYNDQYLKLKGVTLGDTPQQAEAEVLAMRKARAIALKSSESDADFIAPDQEDKAVENHLTRVKDTIYETTDTPKLSDLSGATATEIKVKYASMDIKTGKKEIYFTGAIKRLIRVLTDMLNAKRLIEAGVQDVYAVLSGEVESSVVLYDADWLAFTINRNLPQNYLEIAQIVSGLAGKVPDSYLYELLWFVDDPVAALEEMKAQKKADAELQAKASIAAMGLDNTGTGEE